MKTVKVSDLVNDHKKHFRWIAKEGFLVTRKGVPVAHVMRPDKEGLKKELDVKIAKSLEEVKERFIQVDTFTKVQVESLETTWGKCDKCQNHTRVYKGGYLNEHGKIVGEWTCIDCKNRKPKVKVLPKEFGGSDGFK